MSFPRRRVYVPRSGGKGPRSGLVVRADDKLYQDSGGKFFPLGTTFFWAWWGWEHDQARTKQNAEFVAPWCDHARTFGEVGGATWEDRAILPQNANYEDIGKAVTDYLFGALGMRQQLTIFGGGSGADLRLTMDKVKRIISGRQDAFLNVQISNESKVDRATARSYAQELQAAFPGLIVGTTSPGNDAEWTADSFDMDVCSCGFIHPDRDQGDENWRQVRQPNGCINIPKTKHNDEGPGFESSIAVLDDPLRLACMRSVGVLAGCGAFTLHTGAGVRGGGAKDLELGRASNFWDYDGVSRPSLSAAVAALQAQGAFLPEQSPNWTAFRGHWLPPLPTSPLWTDAIWSDNPSGMDHGIVRLYGSKTAGAFAASIMGVRRYVDLTSRGAWNLKFYDGLTGALTLEKNSADGEVFRLPGDPSGGSNSGYLVVGAQ